MKLMHIGDLHLGKSLCDFDLKDDQEYILNELLKIAKDNAIDAVLIAGDVYDKSIPSESATRMLDYFLNELAKMNVNVYMISGNHDSDERLNYGSCLFETNNIYISSKFDGTLHKHTLKVGEEEIDIYLMPFVKASQVKHYYQDAEIETYEDAVRVIIDNANIDETKTNLLVAHQFVIGKSKDPDLSGSESGATKNVGTIEKIGCDCFDCFEYVALGHIHSPQRMGREEIRYSGSPLKYSLSEVNNNKSVPLITVKGKGKIDIDLVPLKPMRDLRHLKGKMKDLLNKSNITDKEDYIYVTLTDEEYVNNAMGIFQQYYPNTVKIDYDNSNTKEIEQIDISKITENRSFDELISDFYLQVYDVEISEEEIDIMRSVAREAGVLHETN